MLELIGTVISLMVVLALAAVALLVLSVVVLACLAGLAATTRREPGQAVTEERVRPGPGLRPDGGFRPAGDPGRPATGEERQASQAGPASAAQEMLERLPDAMADLGRRVGRAGRAVLRPPSPDGRAPGRERPAKSPRDAARTDASRSAMTRSRRH
jgi:hypothetical protein